MVVEILGTVGYHPTETRHTTCVFLPELGITFDAGTAFFRLLGRCTTDHLHIFLSHTHLDHVMGLTYFFSLIHEHPQIKVSVHGEAHKLQIVREHLFHPEIFPVMPAYDWQPLVGDSCLLHGAKISWFPLEHPGGAIGYRIDLPGHSLAYVTDTRAEPGAAYIDSIRGVDLLLHECNFPDGQEELARITGHSCLTPVVELAAAAQVKQLVLMHVDPLKQISQADLERARQIFPQLQTSRDGDRFDW
jgi:ribonuclease Z